MKKILSLIFVVTILAGVFVSNVSASDWQWASSFRTITAIYPDVDFQFYLDGATIDLNSECANRFDIWRGDANYDAKVASLLLAFQNGYQILVLFDDDDTGCNTVVSRFRVQRE